MNNVKSLFSSTMFWLPLAALLLTLIVYSLFGPPFEMTTSAPLVNENISSGSGAVFGTKDLAVVGDDEPYLFHVDSNNFTTKKQVLIKQYPLNKSGRIEKSIKPDYEAMDKISYQGNEYFLILGSGSKSTRNAAYLFDMNDKNKKRLNLAPLYKKFSEVSKLNDKEHINIEGVANNGQKIFIFNRGNSAKNIIFEMDLKEFFAFVSKKSDTLTSLNLYFVTLKEIEGFESTLSGVDYWKERDSLVFSSSVERDSDAINDGEVLGSFLGILPIKKLKKDTSKTKPQSLASYMQLIERNGEPVLTKVEAVAIETSENDSIAGVLISDNDDGTSQMIHFDVEI